MASSNFVEAALKWAKVSNRLDVTETREMIMGAEYCKLFLKHWCERAIESRPQIVMLQYSIDATPVKVRNYFTAGAQGSKAVQSVVVGEEFMVQALHMFVHGGVMPHKHRLFFKDPMIMGGKSDAAILPLVQRFLVSDSQFGEPELLRWFHQVHDRGVSISLRHAISGHASVLCAGTVDGSASLKSKPMLEVHSQVGCALHDCHNAIRWCFGTLFPEGGEEVLKTLFIGVSSYRKGVAKVIGHVGEWLALVLDVVPDAECMDEQTLTHAYRCLGLDASLLEVVAGKMRLSWSRSTQRLSVAASFMQGKEAVAELSSGMFPRVVARIRALVQTYSSNGHLKFI
eukprot:6463033-Amphidinium_carterae.1